MQFSVFAVVGIMLVDVVLSGDNALVIGAAASQLPRAQRVQAIIWGGVGALIFRLVLAIFATELLSGPLPLVRAVGGVVLLVIAVRLLLPVTPEKQGNQWTRRPPAERLWRAMGTILVADVTMSIDNVLAVGALAAGDVALIVAGLALSMLLLFIASALIAQIVARFAWLIDLAALVLALTAANLVIEDPVTSRFFALTPLRERALQAGCVAFMILVDVVVHLVRRRRARRRAVVPAVPDRVDAVDAISAGREEAQ